MKKIYKYTALAVLALGFTACSQDDDFAPQQEDIVKIASANIATEVQTRVNTLGDGTSWENNDQILLVNNSRTTKNSGTYTATVTTGDNPTTTWSLSSGTVLYASGNNDFTAYYPAVTEADYTLPTDQSTVAGIKLADRMVATATSVAKGDAVALSFERQNAKIAITPTLATEFTGKSISSLLIAGITPYHPEEATDYTAIITPSETGFSVSVTVDGQSLTAASSTKIEAGKHYTFDLKVGKNAIQIMNVSVTKWNEIKINDVESNEYISPNVDATSMTSEELKAAVLKKIKMGQYDIIVTLAADAGDVEEYEASEMLVALRTALAESTVPDGSINLTISGIKNIPYEGFIDMIDYFDNNDKNIGGDKLKSLTLTDVETIGEYAFSACTYLESVNMPQVVTVGECAFNEWKKGTKLTSLNLPNATTIGDWAFAYSSLLTSVNLPKVVTIGEFAFGFCDIRTLDLPEVTTVSGEAFSDNYNLVSCSAPKATTIGYYPWGNCSKFETLTLTAAGDFTLANNLFANTPTGQINLVLNKDKESQITQNVDGTATWKTTNSNGGKLEYTFKSINLVE
ncbi:MAG: leucine-rich repeat protein [Alphaproteobacteria bacterium]|nr:leucine-rich repeat protein [Alphaproteobacteria bacterium]